jgi:hypothetical protein
MTLEPGAANYRYFASAVMVLALSVAILQLLGLVRF